MKPKANFKWNDGNLALLCSNCSVIIKTGKDFSPFEHSAIHGNVSLGPQYCKECKSKLNHGVFHN